MKKITSILTCVALTITLHVQAQTQNQTQPQTGSGNQNQNSEPRTLSDKQMSGRLQKDLSTRNTSLGSAPVEWFDSGYGYYGTYSANNQNHMVRYDRDGNYVESMTRKEWNDQIPATTRSAFDGSDYAGQRVTGYWEVSDPGKKGSYYELSDASGKKSRVFSNGDGKFSNQPQVQGQGQGPTQSGNQPGSQRP